VELGEEIATQKNNLAEKATRQQRQRSQANRLMEQTGIAVPDRALENIDPVRARRLAEFLNDDKSTDETTSPLPPKASLAQENGNLVYHLKPFNGGDKVQYVDYLIRRLTEFRKAGVSFGQQFQSKPSFGVTKTITEKQLQCNLHDAARFDEVCAYLKAKIDATILGKKNSAAGVPNYHEFSQPQEAL
jgi:hypothetical protein